MQKQLFRFERLIINRAAGIFRNLKYFPQAFGLYIKYLDKLEDDFALFRKDAFCGMVEFVERTSPHFYLVLSKEELCGIFVLEKFVGNYSAEVVTCFKPKYWGIFTKTAGLMFKDFCFNSLGLKKLKATVYPQNRSVQGILRTCGFGFEAILKKETLKGGLPQDVEIYSVYAEERQ